MKNSSLVVVYGSYGYNGKIIVDECLKKNLQVMLAGRNAEKLKLQSQETGFPYTVVDCTDSEGLRKLLAPAIVVIHCGGPFRHTAKAMSEACLATQTHYTDITGEYRVFESLALLDQAAKEMGVMVMPGTGFDVVPSDCLAMYLQKRLPTATHLQLAFVSTKGRMSRGTARTSVEGLGYGSMIRKDGKLINVPLGKDIIEIDFGPVKSRALCIPWGDISTAWRTTGIPNIEVYMAANDSMIRNAKRSNYFNWLLRMRWVKKYMLKALDKKSVGPSIEVREIGRSFFWGKVTDASGGSYASTIETISGYSLTAKTAVQIAEKILKGNFKPGYQTPAMAYGPDLIMEIDDTMRKDV